MFIQDIKKTCFDTAYCFPNVDELAQHHLGTHYCVQCFNEVFERLFNGVKFAEQHLKKTCGERLGTMTCNMKFRLGVSKTYVGMESISISNVEWAWAALSQTKRFEYFWYMLTRFVIRATQNMQPKDAEKQMQRQADETEQLIERQQIELNSKWYVSMLLEQKRFCNHFTCTQQKHSFSFMIRHSPSTLTCHCNIYEKHSFSFMSWHPFPHGDFCHYLRINQ